jgi:hypothetical protein
MTKYLGTEYRATGEADGNIAIGKGTLTALTNGKDNIVIGDGAAPTVDTQKNQIVIGKGALPNNAATEAIAIGTAAMHASTTTAGFSIAIGREAGGSGSNYVALGLQAGKFAKMGGSVLIGNEVAHEATDAPNSVIIGEQALSTATKANSAIAIGSNAMQHLGTDVGESPIAIGIGAMGRNSGDLNVAVGSNALAGTSRHDATGSNNTVVGNYALNEATTGSNNTAIGLGAGKIDIKGFTSIAAASGDYKTTTESEITYVGAYTGKSWDLTNPKPRGTALGYWARAGEDAIALGHTALAQGNGSVAIGKGTEVTRADTVGFGERDLEIKGAGKGVYLQSPDGTEYYLTVADGGTVSVAAAAGAAPAVTKPTPGTVSIRYMSTTFRGKTTLTAARLSARGFAAMPTTLAELKADPSVGDAHWASHNDHRTHLATDSAKNPWDDAWEPQSSLVLADGTHAYWDGSAWVEYKPITGVQRHTGGPPSGAPAGVTFFEWIPSGATETIADLAALKAHTVFGDGKTGWTGQGPASGWSSTDGFNSHGTAWAIQLGDGSWATQDLATHTWTAVV